MLFEKKSTLDDFLRVYDIPGLINCKGILEIWIKDYQEILSNAIRKLEIVEEAIRIKEKGEVHGETQKSNEE